MAEAKERDLIDAALSVLRESRAEGDVFLEQRRSLRLVVREGATHEITRAETRGMAIRSVRDGRLGFVHASASDPDGAARAARQACALAASASPREDFILAEAGAVTDGRDEGTALGLYDEDLEQRTVTQKIDWIRAAEAAALAFDPKVRRSSGAGWDEQLVSRWLANTRGLYRHYRKSTVGIGIEVVAEDGNEMQVGDASQEAVAWRRLPTPESIGKRAGTRAVQLLGGRPVETCRVPVVFSPDVGWTLLSYLSTALNGDHLSRGRSWLCTTLQDDPRAVIGSPLLTVIDNGLLPETPGSAPFDGEGVDCRSTSLLDRGAVAGRICDLSAGRRLGTGSSGHAQRQGYEGRPDIGTSNLYIAPGSASPEAILESVDHGLWIWGLSGWWVGLEPSNSQFSSAASGLWIEKGQPSRPVARVTIAGPLREILGGIDAVGDDLTWTHPTRTPTFRVREMAVSGT